MSTTISTSTSINKDEMTLLFDEIFPRSFGEKSSSTPALVEVYIVQVHPHDCGRLIRWLANELPLSTTTTTTTSSSSSNTYSSSIICDLSHLKRVRKSKIQIMNNVVSCTADEVSCGKSNSSNIDNNSPLYKKSKYSNANENKNESKTDTNIVSKISSKLDEKIEVILHDVSWLDQLSCNSSDDNNNNSKLFTHLDVLLEKMARYLESSSGVQNKSKNHVSAVLKSKRDCISFQVVKESVPARYAVSEDEWRLFNNIWPVHYFPNKMMDNLMNTMAITKEEQEQMIMGMKAAIDDRVRVSKYNMFGAVVVDPKSGQIVSTSYDEFCIQQNRFETYQDRHDSTNPILLCKQNPLVTSIILACQGVSRIERQHAIEQGMKSENFQKGQYICTGYDVYTTVEPTTFEAMALIHSRINRLIFGRRSCDNTIHNNIVHHHHQRHSSGIVQSQVHDIPGMNHKYRVFQCKQQSDLWLLCCQT